MDNTEFKKNALRTENCDFPKIKERMNEEAMAVFTMSTLRTMVQVGQQLDIIKKYLIYGKRNDTLQAFFEHKYPSIKDGFKPMVKAYTNGIENLSSSEQNIRLVHGILGINTEGIELVEALLKIAEGASADGVNIQEEVGDVNWYEALIADAMNFEIDEANEKVINKLRARFPDKFDEGDAINRDVQKERSILEGNVNEFTD